MCLMGPEVLVLSFGDTAIWEDVVAHCKFGWLVKHGGVAEAGRVALSPKDAVDIACRSTARQID